MPSIEWFYSRGSKRFGPVSAAELKQLADHGELSPDELVWREGMDQWIPARRVKGLFEQDTASAKESKEEVSGPGSAPKEAAGSARPEAARLAEPPSPAAPRPSRPTFEASASAFERAREGSARHLFDVVLESARGVFNAEFIRATTALFTAAGHYGLYAAIVLLLAVQTTLGVLHRSFWAVLFGLFAATVLAVLQYSARRILVVLERLDNAAANRMPSPAFLDCCALLSLIGSLAALVGWTVYAVASQEFGWIVWAVVAFILLEHVAVMALNPESLGLTVAAEATAGEEALGLLVFLVKVAVRGVPVVFGVGVLGGASLLVYAVVLLAGPWSGNAATFLVGLDESAPKTAEAFALSAVEAASGAGAAILLIASAWPLLAYLGLLACHLGIELLRAVLGIPEKLDMVAEGKKPGDMMS